MKFPEQHRSMGKKGESGMFKIPHRIGKGLIYLICIASKEMGWDHVSISVKTYGMREAGRCPIWEEMSMIKDMFFDTEECVVQYHPPDSEYVNNHPHCLHLWRNQTQTHTTPPSMLTGYITNR